MLECRPEMGGMESARGAEPRDAAGKFNWSRWNMIEALKSDELVNRMGGRFKLTALVQRRWAELLNGARPLVERKGRSDLELAIAEILQGKITIDFEKCGVTPPEQALR